MINEGRNSHKHQTSYSGSRVLFCVGGEGRFRVRKPFKAQKGFRKRLVAGMVIFGFKGS